jgi:hypothetical protein
MQGFAVSSISSRAENHRNKKSRGYIHASQHIASTADPRLVARAGYRKFNILKNIDKNKIVRLIFHHCCSKT